jgi:beta-1,4-mannosyl-glycoprotein beta-1,4-N-acetylglucosaminyltransferase
MRVVDVTMYAYEADALAVRLAELDGVVDEHVVTQGTHTFRGEPREVVPLDSVTAVTVDISGLADPWAAEAAHRDASLTVARGRYSDALYLVADCDEIPHPDAIAEARERVPSGGPMRLLTSHRQWAMNLETVLHAPGESPGPVRQQPVIGTWDQLAGGAHAARRSAWRSWPAATAVGWHLTNLMTTESVAGKIRAYAHSEYDTGEYIGRLDQMRADRMDYLGRSALRLTDDVPGCAARFPWLLA